MVRNRTGTSFIPWVILILISGGQSLPAGNPRNRESAGNTPSVVLENESLRWELGDEGRTFRFVDKSTGTDWCDPDAPGGFPRMRVGKEELPATSCSRDGDLIRINFGRSGYAATLKTTLEPHSMTLEVVAVEGEGVEAIIFMDIPLLPAAKESQEFSACALALNLQTNVTEIPGPMTHLRAECYHRFGLIGAKVGVITCPYEDLRGILKTMVAKAQGLPQSKWGGPWALDAESARGSYLIDSNGEISESNVEEWIGLARNLGIRQIDLHTGHSLRFGDYVPNPEVFPRGVASLRAITDRLHEAGMLVGLHTYAFFIAKDTPWVTPVPDPRLAKGRTFTLAENMVENCTTIPVLESTEGMSTVTGFQIRNSATLQIDEELITFGGVSTTPPYRFLDCTRGAHGTRVATHLPGAKVAHLKECFGLFVPEGDSSLFIEVAEKTANLYNKAGFDMIYLDALDGADVIDGWENSWHYAAKFVFELANRLDRPALFEMSTMTHHLWCVRSRMGAWDCPSRGNKRFIDMHAISNEESARSFLPTNLGWWGVFDWNGVQPERTFPDDIEYLCSKSVGYDSGLSLLVGFTPETYSKSLNIRRLAEMIRQYEELRRSGEVPAQVRQRLRTLGEEFTLDKSTEGITRFRPIRYEKHLVEGDRSETRTWRFQNPFVEQPMRLRIEALLSTESYDSPGNVPVMDLADEKTFGEVRSQEGIDVDFERVSSTSPEGSIAAKFSAENRRGHRDGSWAMVEKTFSPLVNLADKGLGLWVHGDGKAEVLNFQFKSPAFLGGGLANHYLDIDWTGWRYVTLVEPDEDQIGRFDWPFAGSASSWRSRKTGLAADAYPNLHVWVSYDRLESIGLWFNNLPIDDTATVVLSPIHAVPLKKSRLKNPTVAVGGKRITFPIELESGCYLECRDWNDCVVYDAKGEPIQQVEPQGELPMVKPGDNEITLSFDPTEDTPIRTRVTTILLGETL